MVLGGFILMGYYFYRNRAKLIISRAFFRNILLLAVFNIFLANALEFWGLQYMSSAKTCFIYNLAPFFSAFFAYIHFSEKLTIKKWFGLLVSFLGFIPIIMSESPAEEQLSHIMFLSSAEFVLLIATVAMVYGWIIMQNIIRKKNGDIIVANGMSMIIGGIFSFVISGIFETWHPVPVITWWPFFGWLMAIVIISNIICYTLYAELLKTYTATFLAFTGLTGPLFAALYDWLFFGTHIVWDFYLAMMLVFVGLYFFYQEELRQGYMTH